MVETTLCPFNGKQSAFKFGSDGYNKEEIGNEYNHDTRFGI